MGSGASGSLADNKKSLAPAEAPPSKLHAASAASNEHRCPAHPTLELTFADELARERVMRFHERPLGFEITLGAVPIRVENVYLQGLARKVGVEMGWHLVKVNSTVLASKGFEQQFAMVKQGMASLPVAEELNVAPTLQSLEIIFEAGPDGKNVPVTFSKKPLGFEFDLIAPIKVKNIQEDCVAKRHGVEVGWVVKEVGGVDLCTRAFHDQVDILKKSVSALPDVTYCIAPPLGHSISANLAPAKDVKYDPAKPPPDRKAGPGSEISNDGRL